MSSLQINVGDEIELSLMRRDRNSLFAVPVDAYFPDINERHPSISGQGNKSYSQVTPYCLDLLQSISTKATFLIGLY